MTNASTPIKSPTIQIDGTQLHQNDDLTQLVVTQSIGAAAHAHLRVSRPDANVDTFRVGSTLAVGVSGEADQLFDGIIVSVGLDWRADRKLLTVDAYDRSYKLARKTVVHSYLDMSASDIVARLAQESGLTSEISAQMNVTYEHLQQWSSPHRMLTELCHLAGCEWWVEGSKLVVKRRAEAAGGAVAELSGNGDLRRFTARFTSMEQAQSVVVRGWDEQRKAPVVGTATGVNSGAAGTPTIVTTAKDNAVATSWPGRVALVDDVDQLATGIAARMGAAALSARGETWLCTPQVRPGRVITISDVSTPWNGNYYVTEVEHVFGLDQPFVTHFVAGSSDDDSLPGVLGSTSPSGRGQFTGGLTIGIVTNNQDAERKLNRVKVKLPYLSDQDESAWARLVLPGAGANRGLMVIPEIDDEVLVGFENGDIRRPYVLGGLWNGKDTPPGHTGQEAVASNSQIHTRSFVSRKGHKITIVDGSTNDKDSIRVELAGAKAHLEVADQLVSLIHSGDMPLTVKTAKGSFEIKPSGDIVVKGNNITLEAQQAITLKASGDVKVQAAAGVDVKGNTQVKVNGAGGVKVESSALVEIAGSLVKVN